MGVRELTDGTQCIYIPNRYLAGFIQFYENDIKTGLYRKRQFEKGTLYADASFKGYLARFHKNDKIRIMSDCMVDHIDFLIGGSSMNVKRTGKTSRAFSFDNNEEIELLTMYMGVKNGTTTNRN